MPFDKTQYCSTLERSVPRCREKNTKFPSLPAPIFYTPHSRQPSRGDLCQHSGLYPSSPRDWNYPRIWAYFGAKKIEPSSDTLLTAASGPSLWEATVDAAVHLFCVYNVFLSRDLDEFLGWQRFGDPRSYHALAARLRCRNLCTVRSL